MTAKISTANCQILQQVVYSSGKQVISPVLAYTNFKNLSGFGLNPAGTLRRAVSNLNLTIFIIR